MKRLLFGLSLFACVVSIAACSSNDASEIQAVPVTGSVTLNGEPAEGISVTFFPADGTSGNGGYGTTTADGAFELVNQMGSPGVAEGNYVVLFSKMRTPDGQPIPKDAMAADVEAINVLPPVYNNMEKSPFRVTVSASGANLETYELKSK